VNINRVLAGTIVAAIGFIGSITTTLAQGAAQPATVPSAAPATSGPQYREFVIGDAKAPVTIIEYASLTCSHCAHFHQTAYQEIKKNYVDTGKVRFVFRDYPLDGLGTAGAVLARCAPGDRGMKLIDMMFKNQDTWVRSEKPIEPLKGYAQLAGMSSADVDACLKNEAIVKAVREVQNTGTTLYKIQSTPTFFVDDEKIDGDRGYEFMAKLIDKKLEAKKK
jgi:protein-disulfide isomerase